MPVITKGKTTKTKAGKVSGLALISYGPDGIGKTTFATAHKNIEPSSLTEKALVLDVEKGSHALDVSRVEAWDMEFPEIGKTLKEIKESKDLLEEYEILVIDSVDWLVSKIEKYVCARHSKNNISDFPYGSGTSYVLQELIRLISVFDDLREEGLHVHLLAHAKTTQVEDPISPVVYQKYDLAVHQKLSARLKEWADVVAFLYFKPASFTEEDLGFGKTRRVAHGDSKRTLSVLETVQWEAKSRYQLPREMPLDGENYLTTIATARGL